jgi:hypothetical protein
MRGLNPRIHRLGKALFVGWMAGSSPAMTERESAEPQKPSEFDPGNLQK